MKTIRRMPRKQHIVTMKRILALATAVLLVALYGSTLVFALMGSPNSKNLLMASVYCTIAVPVVLYAWQLALRMFGKKKEEKEEEE